MEDIGNYGYTLFRTIPVLVKKHVSYSVSNLFSRKNALVTAYLIRFREKMR